MIGNPIDALEAARKLADVAGRLAFSADRYLALLQEEKSAPVELGGFFITFDGSLVHVARPWRACNCPTCRGRQLMTNMLAGREPDEPPVGEPGHVEHDRWVISVIRGGSGIEGGSGANPGDTYIVNSGGMTVIDEVGGSGLGSVVCQGHLGLIGLSLRRRATVYTNAAGVLKWE